MGFPPAYPSLVLILGIESSCDETAAAVLDGPRRVRSSIVASQTDLHAEYAGVVPEIASRAHVERILPVVRRALAEAGITLSQLEAVAVGHRPGLIGSLLVGVAAAKALAWSLGLPLIGVDHVQAHLYSGVLDRDERDEGFPALGLAVSGGHTATYLMRSWIDANRLGGTIDDAVGEAFDKAATILGLPFPGGPNLDRLAQSPGANPKAIELPISRLGADSLDFSFSGLKTALLYQARGVPGRRGEFTPAPALTPERRADLAASFQLAAVRSLMLKLERARAAIVERTGACRMLACGGGVTANSLLRRELEQFAAAHGLALRLPAPAFCIDNAAMIAGLGCLLLNSGARSDLSLAAEPSAAI